MLLRWALAVTTGKSRGHGRIARFKFIDVRENESTMVARLPQQVLLLLVLVTGASTGETEDPRWSTYSARKTSRSSLPRSWPSSSLEHAARETRPSNGKLPETSSWSVERSSPGTRSDLSFLGTVVERSEEDEDGRRMESLGGNDTKNARITSHNPSISSRSSETSQTDPSNRISIESSSSESTTIGYHLVRTSPTSRSSYDIMPETQLSFETLVRRNLKTTTSMTTYTKNFTIPRRHMRHVSNLCEKFQITDKMEFYSPNYPELYPNSTDCVRVLEADKGMLLKLDFRDEFELEDSPDCRFDFLEIRDGQYGYSNLLGNFCGTNFPPEITSKTRYLWLRFHSDENIEGKGFKAVWNTIPRPTNQGIPLEQEPCIFNKTGEMEMIIHSDDVKDKKAQAEKEGLPLDCMWFIQVKDNWKILLIPEDFELKYPNECETNFIDVFEEKTDESSRQKKFCGSIADSIVISKNIAYLRFYTEPKALNSTFKMVITAMREKGNSACNDDEYDCEDTMCIAAGLECNDRTNCRLNWDEEDEKCKTKITRLIDSHHIVIILVVFSLIIFGMSFAFVFNCIRKLIRDHRIIQIAVDQPTPTPAAHLHLHHRAHPSSTATDRRIRNTALDWDLYLDIDGWRYGLQFLIDHGVGTYAVKESSARMKRIAVSCSSRTQDELDRIIYPHCPKVLGRKATPSPLVPCGIYSQSARDSLSLNSGKRNAVIAGTVKPTDRPLIVGRNLYFDSSCFSTKFDKAQAGLGQHVVRTMASSKTPVCLAVSSVLHLSPNEKQFLNESWMTGLDEVRTSNKLKMDDYCLMLKQNRSFFVMAETR
ncbi:PREDICTED: uncharacterized protein LOC105621579 [Atta cephalotes]|uniref:CUB domain-containing protein n=1 Tax=Atta cephalotes TaxID=12957 RepID=A0A158NLN1_ATTCE|nr:PREDICTED: uncharacterized protein LOC105621579 [Atta cephalotes]